jgi:hypothetical protein
MQIFVLFLTSGSLQKRAAKGTLNWQHQYCFLSRG